MHPHRRLILIPLLSVCLLTHYAVTISLDSIDIDSALDNLATTLKSLQAGSQRNKDVVTDLTRQILLNQFQAEERVRSQGDSGVKQIRYTKLGSESYHANTFVGNSFISIHDHSNNDYSLGMGEYIVVLNGVEFRTRHNDYMLTMPSQTSKEYHKAQEIPYPPVPPSVQAKATVEEQILEMREYFKAFKTQDLTLRDYRPYFRPVLSYLEGAWTLSDKDTIEESFKSDRHRLDANSWFDLQEKIRYTSYVGTKDPSENYANLPTSIIGLHNETGEPIYTQWNYRIMGWPIQLDDVPTSYFKLVDDLNVRYPKGWTPEQVSEHRSAHFRFDNVDEQRYTTGVTLLDKIIRTIPGKDNIPEFINDDIFGNTLYYQDYHNQTEINLGYYNHWFKHGRKGAMGTSVVLRGFSDANVYVAYTTQPQVAPFHFDHCLQKVCRSTDTRVSWMIPLEVIYLTPLMAWNPYNLFNHPGRNHREFPTKQAEYPSRDGRMHPDRAFNGTNFRNFYRTPSEFYERTIEGEDPADTAKSGIYVLDPNGQMRRTEASGIYVLTPHIPGVGRVRTRYPIAPIHQHGSATWKELTALKHLLSTQVGESNNGLATTSFKMSPASAAYGSHIHTFTLSAGQMAVLHEGKTLEVETSERHAHTHTLTVSYDPSRRRYEYVWCGYAQLCADRHGTKLILHSAPVA